MNKLFLALFTIVIMASSISAESNKEAYQLKEQCGKYAANVLKDFYGNGISRTEDSLIMSSYTNHYNRNLNKCFVLLTSEGTPSKKEDNHGMSTDKTHWDINENKEYGGFFKFNKFGMMQCYVSE